MAFVSCRSGSGDDLPAPLRALHVGAEEAGTAEVLRWLCEDGRVKRGEGDLAELVAAAVAKSRSSLLLLRQGGGSGDSAL